MKAFRSQHPLLSASAFALASALACTTGCKQKAPETLSDSALTTNLQSKLASDSGLANEPIQVSVSNGTAMLNGSVDSQAAKSLASNDAMQVPGIAGVMNNLNVQAAAVGSVQAVAPPPQAASSFRSNRDRSADRGTVRDQDNGGGQQGASQNPSQDGGQGDPASQNMQQASTYQQPAPPPAPVVQTVTIPAGTVIPVRLSEALNSGTTQPGTAFHGSLASDLMVNGVVAIPHGASIVGKVDDVKDAGHFKGAASISTEVNYIRAHGQSIAVTTDPYVEDGKGRGKNTLEKTGAGAAVGAILGGIFGGGKGAAIGAAAGGGVGAGSNAITRGQQVVIPSETIVNFRLSAPVVVTTSGGSATNYDSNTGDATLQHRPNQ